MDRFECLLLRQSKIAELGQFKAGAEGGGPGGIPTKLALGRRPTLSVGRWQERSQCLAVAALAQDPQDPVTGLCDRVEVRPGGAIAGDGIEVPSVVLD